MPQDNDILQLGKARRTELEVSMQLSPKIQTHGNLPFALDMKIIL